jgi:predicted aspartyl protease
MRINGRRYRCADEVVRPVVRAAVLAFDGTPVQRFFLIDTGADRTVLTSDLLEELGLSASDTPVRLVGAGGTFATVDVVADFRFTRDDSGEIMVTTRCAAVVDADALEMSVLGRDVIELFTLIVDRPGNVVCLLGQRHGYRVTGP